MEVVDFVGRMIVRLAALAAIGLVATFAFMYVYAFVAGLTA